MKQVQIRNTLRTVEIDKLIPGSHVEQLPELIIDLILYFTYSYRFKNSDELKSAVKGYSGNMKQYGNISLWNVSNVTNMMFMFMLSQFQGDISKWNVSNVTNMGYMLYKSQFQGDISDWVVKP